MREQRERDHREHERRAHERGAGPPADDDFSMYLVSTRWNCSQMPITSSCRMFILRWYSRSSVCLSSVATTDERVQPCGRGRGARTSELRKTRAAQGARCKRARGALGWADAAARGARATAPPSGHHRQREALLLLRQSACRAEQVLGAQEDEEACRTSSREFTTAHWAARGARSRPLGTSTTGCAR